MSRNEVQRDWLRGVLAGEQAGSSRLGRLATSENGMISIMAMVTVLFFMVLLALLANVLLVVNNKVEVQNGADAVAISAATQQARGMNTITVINHLMGEMLALVVVHDAIAGDRPLDKRTQDTRSEDQELTSAYNALKAAGGEARAYNDVKKEVKVEAGILDAQKDLKKSLAAIYRVMALGKVLEKMKPIPYVGPAIAAVGKVLYTIGQLLETYAHVEWYALAALEKLAEVTEPVVRPLFEVGLPAAARAALDVKNRMPEVCQGTARTIGERNGVTGGLFPERPRLPLVDDPGSKASSKEQMKHSQIVRAAWPWTVYHRKPLSDVTGWMKFSRFRKHYRIHTEGYGLKKAFDLYQKGAYLQVIEDMQPQSKGSEPWATGDSARVDRMFCLMGFAHRPRPVPLAETLYRRGSSDGLVTFAQAMVYNANPQRGGGTSQRQPVVGWDTLNWVDEPAFEHPAPGASASAPFPRIRANWQAKLVPVTRLQEAQSQVKSPFDSALRRLDPASPLARTH